jgi:transcriptional regulator with XRE-family HTH domain
MNDVETMMDYLRGTIANCLSTQMQGETTPLKLSHKSGVPVATIKLLLIEKISSPSLEDLCKIAVALNCDVRILMDKLPPWERGK